MIFLRLPNDVESDQQAASKIPPARQALATRDASNRWMGREDFR